MELSDKIHDKIITLSDEGDFLLENEKTDEALEKFQEALVLVPSPKSDWEASLWLYAAIGDSFFIKEDFKKALGAFRDAYNCPEAVNNPYINLKIGESYFELEDFEKAKEFLLRTYMLEGKEIFEDENEEYFALIEPLI